MGMTYFELNKFVRENNDRFGVYDCATVEAMRESLAAPHYDAEYLRLREKLSLLQEKYQREKRYDVSDELRNILEDK